ncbi:MAG: HDOD domain-containing protein [Sandaracinaceae bacterium]
MSEPLRVMVVDHEPVSRGAGLRLLTASGHEVVSFASVAACVPHLSRSHLDAILVELHLPKLGGLSLLRSLRKRALAIPVVITGATVRPAERREIKQLGAVFLSKPYGGPQLESALRDVLPAGALAAAMAPSPVPYSILDHLDGRGLERLLSKAKLPVLDPRVTEVQRFLTAADPPSSTVIASVVEADPRLSAALVQRANSVSYRGSVDVVALPVAITRLGIREVLRVVLEVVLQEGFKVRSALLRTVLSDLWEDCVAGARGAREMAAHNERLGLDQDEVFMATLMHDLGRPFLACALDRVDEPLDRERVDQILDAHHARAGARLLTEWGMPPQLIGMTRTHDGPPSRLTELAALAKLASLRVRNREEDAEMIAALESRLHMRRHAGAA